MLSRRETPSESVDYTYTIRLCVIRIEIDRSGAGVAGRKISSEILNFVSPSPFMFLFGYHTNDFRILFVKIKTHGPHKKYI